MCNSATSRISTEPKRYPRQWLESPVRYAENGETEVPVGRRQPQLLRDAVPSELSERLGVHFDRWHFLGGGRAVLRVHTPVRRSTGSVRTRTQYQHAYLPPAAEPRGCNAERVRSNFLSSRTRIAIFHAASIILSRSRGRPFHSIMPPTTYSSLAATECADSTTSIMEDGLWQASVFAAYELRLLSAPASGAAPCVILVRSLPPSPQVLNSSHAGTPQVNSLKGVTWH